MAGNVVTSFTVLFVAITGTRFVFGIHNQQYHVGRQAGRTQSAIPGNFRGTEELRQMCAQYFGTPPPYIEEHPRAITNGDNLNNPSVATPHPPQYDAMKPVLGFDFDLPMENVQKCTNSLELIYKKTGECKKPGDRCGPLMKLYKDPSSNNLSLDCDCMDNDGQTYRPIVYWPPTDQCYHLFDRGPCANVEWLLIHGNGQPICVPRSCRRNKENDPKKYWFTYKGDCYSTETRGFCRGSELLFHYNKEGPHGYLKCGKPEYPGEIQTKTLAGPASDLPCKPGHKKTLNGDCSHKVSFA